MFPKQIKTSRLSANTARIQSQRTAGHVNFTEDKETAYVWTGDTWCAGMTIERGDMDQSEFETMIGKIAAMAKRADAVKRKS